MDFHHNSTYDKDNYSINGSFIIFGVLCSIMACYTINYYRHKNYQRMRQRHAIAQPVANVPVYDNPPPANTPPRYDQIERPPSYDSVA